MQNVCILRWESWHFDLENLPLPLVIKQSKLAVEIHHISIYVSDDLLPNNHMFFPTEPCRNTTKSQVTSPFPRNLFSYVTIQYTTICAIASSLNARIATPNYIFNKLETWKFLEMSGSSHLFGDPQKDPKISWPLEPSIQGAREIPASQCER